PKLTMARPPSATAASSRPASSAVRPPLTTVLTLAELAAIHAYTIRPVAAITKPGSRRAVFTFPPQRTWHWQPAGCDSAPAPTAERPSDSRGSAGRRRVGIQWR